MSRRTIVSLTASAIIGIACIVTVSTDAFAYRRGVGVGRVGVHHGRCLSRWRLSWCSRAPRSCRGRRSCCGWCGSLRGLRSLRRLSPLRLRTLPALLLAGLCAAARAPSVGCARSTSLRVGRGDPSSGPAHTRSELCSLHRADWRVCCSTGRLLARRTCHLRRPRPGEVERR